MTSPTHTQPVEGAPHLGLNQQRPIALRLTDADLERTAVASRHAGHRPTSFARHLFLQALANYENSNDLRNAARQ